MWTHFKICVFFLFGFFFLFLFTARFSLSFRVGKQITINIAFEALWYFYQIASVYTLYLYVDFCGSIKINKNDEAISKKQKIIKLDNILIWLDNILIWL